VHRLGGWPVAAVVKCRNVLIRQTDLADALGEFCPQSQSVCRARSSFKDRANCGLGAAVVMRCSDLQRAMEHIGSVSDRQSSHDSDPPFTLSAVSKP
jgi:hypothetical protein